MEFVLIGLMLAAGLLSLIGSIMFLVAAFRQSPWWGLAVLFLAPIANLVFLIMYWDEARKAFLIQILGMVAFVAAIGASIMTGAQRMGTFQQIGGIEISAPEFEFGGSDNAQGLSDDVWEDTGVKVEGNFVGMTLEEVRQRLGKPRAEMTVGGETTLHYPGLELYSEDGEHVTSQGVPVERR